MQVSHLRKLSAAIHPDTLERHRSGVRSRDGGARAEGQRRRDGHSERTDDSAPRVCETGDARLSGARRRALHRRDADVSTGPILHCARQQRCTGVCQSSALFECGSAESALTVALSVRFAVLTLLSRTAALNSSDLADHFAADLARIRQDDDGGAALLRDTLYASSSDARADVASVVRAVNGDAEYAEDCTAQTEARIGEDESAIVDAEWRISRALRTCVKNNAVRFDPRLDSTQRTAALDTLCTVLTRDSVSSVRRCVARLVKAFDAWSHVPVVFGTDERQCASAPPYTFCLPWFVSDSEFIDHFNANIDAILDALHSEFVNL